MFNFLKSNEFKIVAPVDGQVVELEQVPDPTFAEKMVGEGAAIIPGSDTFVAPISGVLRMIFRTNHAYIIEADNGIQVLVHIGLDTVHLNGEGFERLATEGSKIKAGAPVVRIDREKIAAQGINLISPVVICERPKVESVQAIPAAHVTNGKDTIILCKLTN